MKKTTYYRQCRLQKHEPECIREEVSYLPNEFGIVGRRLMLQDSDGNWERGWTVVSAGELRPAETVERWTRHYRQARRVTAC